MATNSSDESNNNVCEKTDNDDELNDKTLKQEHELINEPDVDRCIIEYRDVNGNLAFYESYPNDGIINYVFKGCMEKSTFILDIL